VKADTPAARWRRGQSPADSGRRARGSPSRARTTTGPGPGPGLRSPGTTGCRPTPRARAEGGPVQRPLGRQPVEFGWRWASVRYAAVSAATPAPAASWETRPNLPQRASLIMASSRADLIAHVLVEGRRPGSRACRRGPGIVSASAPDRSSRTRAAATIWSTRAARGCRSGSDATAPVRSGLTSTIRAIAEQEHRVRARSGPAPRPASPGRRRRRTPPTSAFQRFK